MFSPYSLNMLLNQHGKTITLTKQTFGDYNPVIGSVETTTATYSIKGYFFDYVDNMVDGDSVQRGDRRVVLKNIQTNGSATPLPDSDDLVTDGTTTMKVVKSSVMESQGNVLCYLLQVRT